MLLVIEQGNSNTVFAVRDGERWVAEYRLSTRAVRTADDYAEWLGSALAGGGLSLAAIDGCVASSVVPPAIPALRAFAGAYLGCPAVIVGEDVRPRLEVRLPEPQAVGADRLINALGGYRTYGGPLLIVDSGTALKFDMVGADGAFEGGAIAPGLAGSAAAMFRRCALLNAVPIERPARAVGRTTGAALQSGLFFGYLGMIEQMIVRMREASPDPLTVVATGGVNSLFDGQITGVDHYDLRLTLTGLAEVWHDLVAGHGSLVARPVAKIAFPPESRLYPRLAEATFHDAFETRLDDTRLSASEIAERLLAATPAWVETLLRVRNRAVALVGLKDVGALSAASRRNGAAYQPGERLSIFEVQSISPDEVVMGIDDRHLDVRISFLKRDREGRGAYVVSSWVKTHNALGRLYMVPVGRIHPIVVRTAMRTLDL